MCFNTISKNAKNLMKIYHLGHQTKIDHLGQHGHYHGQSGHGYGVHHHGKRSAEVKFVLRF